MKPLTASAVHFKGIREGLLLTVSGASDSNFDRLLDEVQAELAGTQGFFQDSRVVLDLGERHLVREQLGRLQSLLAEHELVLWAVLAQGEETKAAARDLGLGTRLAGSATDLEGNQVAVPGAVREAPAPLEEASPANALLLRETIRSGQSIYNDGHVVVIGDVNPGAEVVATGNVIVWGRLRGLVHAGAEDDPSAIICALELAPTQLRIAGLIAIPPAERDYEPIPERASIRDGHIVADSWQARD